MYALPNIKSIVLKICSSQVIVQQVTQEKVFDLAEESLFRLLINGLDKIGEQIEGEQITKNLNASILRIFEIWNHTYTFCALVGIIKKSRYY